MGWLLHRWGGVQAVGWLLHRSTPLIAVGPRLQYGILRFFPSASKAHLRRRTVSQDSEKPTAVGGWWVGGERGSLVVGADDGVALDSAAVAKVRAEVRAEGVQHGCTAVLASKPDHLDTERRDREHLPAATSQ